MRLPRVDSLEFVTQSITALASQCTRSHNVGYLVFFVYHAKRAPKGSKYSKYIY